MRTAYIYVTDGDRKQYEYRRHAISCLLRHIPSAHVFTFTGGNNKFNDPRIPGETVIHVDGIFGDVYGDGAIGKKFGPTNYPAIAFARLLPPIIRDLDDYDRFVYMDNDTEVISSSFSAIETLDLGDHVITGAQETYRDKAAAYVRHIKGKTGKDIQLWRYINAGVLVIQRPRDVESYRDRCRTAFLSCEQYKFDHKDQDAINYVFDDIGEMSDVFNYLCLTPHVPAGVCLCHFAGSGAKQHYLNLISHDSLNCLDMNQWNGDGDLERLVDLLGCGGIRMLEVGSYRGQSAEQFMLTGKVSKLFCVDPWREGYSVDDAASATDMVEVERDFDTRMRPFSGNVVKVRGNLYDFLSLGEKDIDVVYIDANHAYKSAHADILFCRELIKPRIAYAGHDYTWPGVARAVNELIGKPDQVFKNTSWLKFVKKEGAV